MKLKNVKKGTRVMLKEDYTCLTKGMIGTIIEDDDTIPFISWDNWNNGHDGCMRVGDSFCWSAPINLLKRIKENV